MSIPPKTRIGRYEIRSAIGKGGMGEVYLAKDTFLERDVALKFLSKEFTSDSERLRRFIREAKSASALNHPSIITIYDVGEDNERYFFASEFIEGTTLRDELRTKTLSLSRILSITRQVAEALAAAHSAGIIHRDIKPENIMLRKDGYVKVLDFGLAKLMEVSFGDLSNVADAPTRTLIKTEPGVVMGTSVYMSPEQARGLEVDERTDIWALGVVMYEMLTHRLPFDGKTTSDVIASILKTEPVSISEYRRDVPVRVLRIIERALQKEPEARFQTMSEFLTQIEASVSSPDVSSGISLRGSQFENSVRESNESEAALPTVSQTDHTLLLPPQTTSRISEILFTEAKKHPLGISATLAIVLFCSAIVGIGIYRLIKQAQLAETFQSMRMTKLTFSGNVLDIPPAISPDGKYVAYIVKEMGQQSLMLRHISTSSNVPVLPPSDVVFEGGLSFSPDGSHIYYTTSTKTGNTALFRIPVLGGMPQKIIDDAEGPVKFAGDGKQIVFVRDTRLLIVANEDGTNSRELMRLANDEYWKQLCWSPDGKKIAAGFHSNDSKREMLGLINVEDGKLTVISGQSWRIISGLDWKSESDEVLLSGRDLETGLSQVWSVELSNGNARRITNDLNSYYGVSLSSDAKSFVSVQGDRLSNVWIAVPEEKDSTKRITFEAGRDEGLSGISVAPDGNIVYSIRVAGNYEVWSVKADGTNNRKLTSEGTENYSPCVSADGRFVVFVSNRSGILNLWRMKLDGSEPTQLTHFDRIVMYPDCSPEGNWVVFQVESPEGSTTWKIDVEGNEAVELIKKSCGVPQISPDGKSIACEYGLPDAKSEFRIAVFSADGKSAPELFDFPEVVNSRSFQWTKDGKSFIYPATRERIDNLWMQPIDGSAAKRVTDFSSDKIFRFDISPDGKSFALARGRDGMDVVLISNFD